MGRVQLNGEGFEMSHFIHILFGVGAVMCFTLAYYGSVLAGNNAPNGPVMAIFMFLTMIGIILGGIFSGLTVICGRRKK